MPGAHEEFANALMAKTFYPADSFGVQYRVQSPSDETIGEMKSGKWVAYAARTLAMRFWELAKVSSFPIRGYIVCSLAWF